MTIHPEASIMSKERSPAKESKKKPAHTLKEKRAAKKEKSSSKGSLGGDRASSH
jgi:hypothetical protein